MCHHQHRWCLGNMCVCIYVRRSLATKRWKSMSGVMVHIYCVHEQEGVLKREWGIGIGIRGTGKAGTATSLTPTSCVHSMHTIVFLA